MSNTSSKRSFNEQMRELFRNKIVIAIAGIIFGIILIVHAAAAVDALVRILGAILLVASAVYLIRYFMQKETKQNAFVVMGIILAAAGLFFVIRPDTIVNLFPLIIGIVLILSGVSDLVHAIGLNKAKVQGALVFIVLSILVIVLGVVVLLHPGTVADMLVTVMGISLLINGALDLVILAVTKA